MSHNHAYTLIFSASGNFITTKKNEQKILKNAVKGLKVQMLGTNPPKKQPRFYPLTRPRPYSVNLAFLAAFLNPL